VLEKTYRFITQRSYILWYQIMFWGGPPHKRSLLCKELITMKHLLFLLSAIVCSGAGVTQSQPSTLQKRIHAVENNLIPFVPVKGFKGWNITGPYASLQGARA
jgi:hypothetical protein